jgi:hypothetical protein
MNQLIWPLVCFLALFGVSLTAQHSHTAQAAVSESKDSADIAASMIESLRAAQDFVGLIDRGLYGESWSRGSRLLQATVGQAQWVQALQFARARLGSVKARTLKDQKPAWDPKGLPNGAYMVVEFNVDFEKVANSGELLTLMREAGGTWKVLTYQVN